MISFRQRVFVVVSFAVISAVLVPSCSAADNPVVPFYKPVADTLLTGYQRFISPAKQGSCVMSPTCSGYAREAFASENPFIAYVMTADRLMRSGRDLENYQGTILDGKVRYADPVKYQAATAVPPPKPVFQEADPLNGTQRESPDYLLFRFAKELEAKAEYQQAALEYRRLVSYYPTSPLVNPAALGAFLCLYSAGEYSEAITSGEQSLVTLSLSPSDQDLLDFYISAAYLRLGSFQNARSRLLKVTTPAWKDRVLLLTGLSYASQYRWQEARNAFESLPKDSPYAVQLPSLFETVRQGEALHLKDPTTAGVLGIVPGAGYLYSGYPQTALSALITNLIFGYAAKQAFDREDHALGGLLEYLTLGWYAGSIYGSVKTAQRTNDRLRKDVVLRLQVGFDF